jgi:hypothetical protein
MAQPAAEADVVKQPGDGIDQEADHQDDQMDGHQQEITGHTGEMTEDASLDPDLVSVLGGGAGRRG